MRKMLPQLRAVRFQSTHPARGATTPSTAVSRPRVISIHAPREGCDATPSQHPAAQSGFQSTHPARGATPHRPGGTAQPLISIHAPREGCDFFLTDILFHQNNFNPRTPRGVRRALQRRHGTVGWHFNPRTPRGVRLLKYYLPIREKEISIHAPREGCDMGMTCIDRTDEHFNPRTPRGVRLGANQVNRGPFNFNPRTPRGGPRRPLHSSAITSIFQSTHPARGATHLLQGGSITSIISIHAPREGCDRDIPIHPTSIGRFQSTHPARGATTPTI